MERVTPFIPCCDVWPADKLTEQTLAAYKTLAAQGEIEIIKATVSRGSRLAVIEYNSTIPQDWARDALRRIRDKPKQESFLNGRSGIAE